MSLGASDGSQLSHTPVKGPHHSSPFSTVGRIDSAQAIASRLRAKAPCETSNSPRSKNCASHQENLRRRNATRAFARITDALEKGAAALCRAAQPPPILYVKMAQWFENPAVRFLRQKNVCGRRPA